MRDLNDILEFIESVSVEELEKAMSEVSVEYASRLDTDSLLLLHNVADRCRKYDAANLRDFHVLATSAWLSSPREVKEIPFITFFRILAMGWDLGRAYEHEQDE